MDPRDLTRIRFVGDPQLSPDATRVACVVTTLSEERAEYLANVWFDAHLKRETPAPAHEDPRS